LTHLLGGTFFGRAQNPGPHVIDQDVELATRLLLYFGDTGGYRLVGGDFQWQEDKAIAALGRWIATCTERTRYPSADSSAAVARPIPEVAPVMSTLAPAAPGLFFTPIDQPSIRIQCGSEARDLRLFVFEDTASCVPLLHAVFG
jgi:hypothetical protein